MDVHNELRVRIELDGTACVTSAGGTKYSDGWWVGQLLGIFFGGFPPTAKSTSFQRRVAGNPIITEDLIFP